MKYYFKLRPVINEGVKRRLNKWCKSCRLTAFISSMNQNTTLKPKPIVTVVCSNFAHNADSSCSIVQSNTFNFIQS